MAEISRESIVEGLLSGTATPRLAGLDLSGLDLSALDLHRATLTNANLDDCKLERADLRGIDASGASFRRADLTEANLSAARHEGTLHPLSKNSVVSDGRFEDAILRGAALASLDAKHADFSRADLRGTRLDSANLAGAVLADARLDGACLESTILEGADLRRAILVGTILDRVNLTSAKLMQADLHGVDLRTVTLTTVVSGSVVAGSPADMSCANVRAADLRGVDIRGVTFKEAHLTGTRFDGYCCQRCGPVDSMSERAQGSAFFEFLMWGVWTGITLGKFEVYSSIAQWIRQAVLVAMSFGICIGHSLWRRSRFVPVCPKCHGSLIASMLVAGKVIRGERASCPECGEDLHRVDICQECRSPVPGVALLIPVTLDSVGASGSTGPQASASARPKAVPGGLRGHSRGAIRALSYGAFFLAISALVSLLLAHQPSAPPTTGRFQVGDILANVNNGARIGTVVAIEDEHQFLNGSVGRAYMVQRSDGFVMDMVAGRLQEIARVIAHEDVQPSTPSATQIEANAALEAQEIAVRKAAGAVLSAKGEIPGLKSVVAYRKRGLVIEVEAPKWDPLSAEKQQALSDKIMEAALSGTGGVTIPIQVVVDGRRVSASLNDPMRMQLVEPERKMADHVFFFGVGHRLVNRKGEPLGVVERTERAYAFKNGTTGPAYVVRDSSGERLVYPAPQLEQAARLK